MRLTPWLIPLLLFGLSGRDELLLPEMACPRHDAACSITVRNGRASFHVPPATDGRFVLIVASLGSSSRRFEIRLTASDFDSTRPSRFSQALTRPVRPYRRTFPPQPLGQPPIPAITLVSLPSTSRTFDLPLLNGQPGRRGGSVRVRARLVAHGQRTSIYADDTITTPASSRRLARHVIDLLESQIMPVADQNHDPPADIDGDGRLAILLTPWLDRLQGGQTSVGGFVRGADFHTNPSHPGSNHADMIYLNANLVPGDRLRDILAHEYQHVLACSQRDATGRPPEEDWLNEAIAHLAEPGSTNIHSRVQAYLSNPSLYPLVVPDYFRAGRWRCDGCRGATFLFLDWCRHQHGPGLAARLLRSPCSGVANISRVTATSFPVLFRDWSVAIVSQRDNPAFNGPRVLDWDATAPLALQLHGTSAAFVSPQVDSTRPQLFRIETSPGARLQLTVAWQPD